MTCMSGVAPSTFWTRLCLMERSFHGGSLDPSARSIWVSLPCMRPRFRSCLIPTLVLSQLRTTLSLMIGLRQLLCPSPRLWTPLNGIGCSVTRLTSMCLTTMRMTLLLTPPRIALLHFIAIRSPKPLMCVLQRCLSMSLLHPWCHLGTMPQLLRARFL
jgi:hypothetical protein